MSDASLQAELIVLKKEKRKWQMKNNLTQFAHTCNAIGEIYNQQGKFEEALAEHEEELRACEKVKDVIGCAVANRKIGECYNELADFEKALAYQEKHLRLAQDVNNAIEEQRAWATIGRTYLCQAESLEHSSNKEEYKHVLTKSENAFLRSLDICKSLSHEISEKELMAMKGRLYLNLGLIQDYKGNLTKCADLIKQAIHINEVHDLKEDLNRCQYSLASIYYRCGSCSQALRIVDEAYACAVKLKDITLQSETLLLKTKILLRINDFNGAKYYLKKAYKLNSPNELIRAEIKKQLNISVNICRLEKDLESIVDDDFKGKMLLYEKLGDLCAKIENFDQSLSFYNKMLECAETLNVSDAERAAIYYSLAETYFDLGKYNTALDYYKKELHCRSDNMNEQCKTWLNIAECEFRLKSEYSQLQYSYNRALDCAKIANDLRLQTNCLKDLIRVQEVFNADEKLITEKSLEELMQTTDNTLDDEESNHSSEPELTDLSESSSNSEAENEEFDRPKRKTRKVSAKKNEKGETQLHRACITGYLNQVRRLIEKGHPINPRDNCGWIPLHEAANHDHYEIVEYLIDKGAWVNDRGGSHCDGITPLHDAASCANFSIMRLLIERGASVIAKMNDGQTPLDCLMKWRKRAGEDIDQQLILEYKEMRNKLKVMMDAVGYECNGLTKVATNSEPLFENVKDLIASQSDDENEKSIEKGAKKKFKKRSLTESISDNDESDMYNGSRKSRKLEDEIDQIESPSPDLIETDIDYPEIARIEYISAIDCVRSANSRINQDISPLNFNTEKKLALVNEDDVIVDDWLEDDVGPSTKTNVKITWPVFKSGFKTNNKKSTFKRPKLKQLKFNSILKRKNESRGPITSTITIEEEEITENTFQETTSNQAIPHHILESNSTTSNPSSSMRVRVRIEGKLLLIPILQRELDQTVNWLAEEAAIRYHQMFGLKPVLQLCAADGAVLVSNDKVTDVIAGNEELLGNVETWDLPSLPDRYIAACDVLKTDPFNNIKHLLDVAAISNDLRLLNLNMSPQHLKVTFRALQCQYALRTLSLAGNYMGNIGLQLLVNVLSTLPNLVHLNLSCNNITNLQCLSDIINKPNNEVKQLQMLTDLNLSYNSLENSVTSLSTIIASIPLLSRLEISCCSLDNRILKTQRSFLKAFEDCNRLSVLNISYNDFNVDGIAALLHSLRANQITSLDFTSVLTNGKCIVNDKLATYLRDFFSSENCILEDLSLKDCQISDEVVTEIALCLPHLSCINQLSLANNTELTEASLIALTNNIIKNKRREFQFNVDFSGCIKILNRLKTPLLNEILQYWSYDLQKQQLKFKWTFF